MLRAENLERRPASSLCVGATARIDGLQGAVALNGQSGECVQFDAAKGRWLVRLEKGGAEKLLRPENLRAVLKHGSLVRLLGLTSAPQLNGRRAVCTAWDSSRQRWRVRVEGGEEKMLRPDSLELHGPQAAPSGTPAISPAIR